MGMFDKDKSMAPDGPMQNWVDDGTEFIVYDCFIKDENFAIGDEDGTTVPMAHWVVAPLDAPDNRATVSTIGSAMAEKVRNKADGDLPAVVVTDHVPTDQPSPAYVLRFVRAYEG